MAPGYARGTDREKKKKNNINGYMNKQWPCSIVSGQVARSVSRGRRLPNYNARKIGRKNERAFDMIRAKHALEFQ